MDYGVFSIAPSTIFPIPLNNGDRGHFWSWTMIRSELQWTCFGVRQILKVDSATWFRRLRSTICKILHYLESPIRSAKTIILREPVICYIEWWGAFGYEGWNNSVGNKETAAIFAINGMTVEALEAKHKQVHYLRTEWCREQSYWDRVCGEMLIGVDGSWTAFQRWSILAHVFYCTHNPILPLCHSFQKLSKVVVNWMYGGNAQLRLIDFAKQDVWQSFSYRVPCVGHETRISSLVSKLPTIIQSLICCPGLVLNTANLSRVFILSILIKETRHSHLCPNLLGWH